MANPPLTASLPEGLVLDDGYTITLDAIDPATGAAVAGVVVSEGTITGDTPGGLADLPGVGNPLLLGVGA